MHRLPTSGKKSPHDLFRVSEHVNHLEAVQLREFEAAFRRWKQEAVRVDSVRTRERMCLIFLLLRHTGARLGEVLSLDDTTAFDKERGIVRLGREGRMREVPVPENVFSEVMTALESPIISGLHGEVFHVDPGYFRRICYARGAECGLSKESACPKTLRNSRAVEMLRSGVPITVVKETLGQSSLHLTEVFQQFSQNDATSIVRQTQKNMRKRSSARNAFVGHVASVVRDAVMAEVVMETLDGVVISAVITADSLESLQLEQGSPVVATIKAPLVNVLACSGDLAGSARNRLRATVLRIAESPVLVEVTGVLPDGTEVCALISAEGAKELELKTGQKVEFWFKALSVVLNAIQV